MPKPNRKKGQKSSEAQRVEVPREPEPIPEEPQVQEEDGATSSKRLMRKEKKQAKQEMARQAAVALAQLAPGRQKSEPTVEVPQSAPAPEPTPAPIPEPAPAPIQEPKVKVEIAEELESLTLGSSRKRRPRKKKTDGSSTAQSVTAPAAQPVADTSSQPFTGLSSQPVAGPSSQPVATVCQPGGDGTQVVPAPVTGAAKSLMQMKPSPSSPWPQPAPIAQSSAPLGAWGRGRGRAPEVPIIPASHSTPQFAQSLPVPTSPPQTTTPPQSTSRPQTTTPAQSYRPQTISPAQSTSRSQTISPAQSTSRPQTISQAQSTSRPQSTPQIKTICRYRIPNKIPGRFVGGRPITVLTNYLEMTFKTLTISRYDVSFTPDRPKKLIPLVFKKIKEKYFPQELIAFDQSKNCYSLRPLPNVPQNDRFLTAIEIQDTNGKGMRFEVAIKPTGLIDLGNIKRYMTEGTTCLNTPTEEIQCIDVILRQGTLESYVKAGRQFFRRPRDPIDLGHGYEMWTGLFQSAIFTSKAFVNIDVAHKGFPRHQPLINAITHDFNLDLKLPANRQRPYDVELFLSFLRGLKVTATILGGSSQNVTKREYICVGIVDPPGKQKFVLNEQDGKQRNITVGEYYATEKNYQIKYPQFNCIWVGSKQKTIFFPAELLEVTYGQPLARQLNETQVSRMVREAATPPDQRMKKITEVISSMQYSTNKDFKKFGMDISDKFYEVKAKILEPPLLDIGRGTAMPRKGQWQAPQLLKPESLLNWGFIAVECGQGTDYNFVIDTIMNAGKQMGMKISQPTIARFDVTMHSLQRMLTDISDQGIINFMFVVISTRGRDHYHLLKQMAESKIGMLTQCMKEATARRMSPMTAKNILLKVNSKLMGINHALGDKTMPRCLRDGGVMIVGADVTHPSPDQDNVPSIAAVTASIDAKCYMYNIELSVQTPKKEMIVEFADMMYDHLKVYQQRNMNQLPRKIFVFRDGVSEGQFAEVMNSELAAVHTAYARIAGPTKKPEILFLLVQKRHHTRFFNKGQYCQYNVEPGTVVDTDIVHASELDFYLVSHQAIKGTARPTRYHAVCNDGKIPDDEVEQLTFYLCHLYSRCSRSVSYPTPTYYAHLACLRARSLTYGKQFVNKELTDRPQRIRVLDKMLQRSRMFFV